MIFRISMAGTELFLCDEIAPRPQSWIIPPAPFTFCLEIDSNEVKCLRLLDMLLEESLSIPMTKETESNKPGRGWSRRPVEVSYSDR